MLEQDENRRHFLAVVRLSVSAIALMILASGKCKGSRSTSSSSTGYTRYPGDPVGEIRWWIVLLHAGE